MIITIDPGHTKKVNKGVISGYYEGDAMYLLANFLADELSEYKNTEVVLTRNENENPSLEERGNLAQRSGSRIFISLHSNATSESESAAYVCGFYSVKRGASATLCKKLVSAVTDVMKKTTAAWNRGALTKKTSSGDDYYGVIRNSVESEKVEYSFIIEHGFHTNKKECAFLMDESNLKKIAKAEADVIASYFSLERKEKFVIARTEIFPDGDLNSYVRDGSYYFSGFPHKVINIPPTENEGESFILDVTSCLYQEVPYVVQRIYYLSSGKEYLRGIYVRNGIFDEVHKPWGKR